MTELFFTDRDTGAMTEVRSPGRRVARDWPLLSDILSHRAGMPEHLILWRRATDEPDPVPRS